MKLFAFDFQGTLVQNNSHAVLESTNLSLERHGRKERATLEFCIEKEGEPWGNYFRELCKDASDDDIKSMVDYALSSDDRVIPKYVRPTSHAISTLKEIKRRKDSVLVISGTNREAFEKYMKYIPMKHLIDEFIGIVNREEVKGNYDVAEWKGRELRKFMSKNDFEEGIFTGDKPDDIKAGIIAGTKNFFFNQDGIKYPFADYCITDFRFILPIIYDRLKPKTGYFNI